MLFNARGSGSPAAPCAPNPQYGGRNVGVGRACWNIGRLAERGEEAGDVPWLGHHGDELHPPLASWALGKRIVRVRKAKGYDDIVGVLEIVIVEANRAALASDPSLTKLLTLEREGKGVDVPYHVQQFTSGHRHAYRQYVGRMETWLGMSEIQVLAQRFHVTFSVYVTSTGRFFDLDIPVDRNCAIHSHCLIFTGDHWEVGLIESREPPAVTDRIETNGLGDCSIEAFLTLLSVTYPIAAVNARRRQWAWVDEYRALRRTHCADGAYDQPVPVALAAVVVAKLRNFLKGGMTEDEVKDAMMAVPGLRLTSAREQDPQPERRPATGKPGKWGDYVTHVRGYFQLTNSLVCQVNEDRSLALATNIKQIEFTSLLKKPGISVETVLGLSRKVESRKYRPVSVTLEGSKESEACLTHLGFMLAGIRRITGQTSYLMCVIANFAAGRRDEASPYMFTGKSVTAKPVKLPDASKRTNSSEVELFSALDMHTECYSFFILDRFIQQHLDPSQVTKVSIRFVLQLDMCHRCRKAAEFSDLSYPCSDDRRESSAQSSQGMPEDLVSDVSALLSKSPKLADWNPFS